MKLIYVVTYYILLEQHHIEVYFNKEKAFKSINTWIKENDCGTITVAIERLLK